MNKPTLFFSHSSKDKAIILPIKEKIDQLTGNVFDIFMSSDGQSIPFGSNWVHKIETGLQEAKIMFVFVTETSLSSGWIYFESGFAYSKGIQVIPVGVGVNIGDLNPPLNLLQGFNLTSCDSLNNFISIINKAFDYKFEENFSDDDYSKIVNLMSGESYTSSHFDKIISYADTVIHSKDSSDTDKLFDNIIKYLEQNDINYSKQNNYGKLRNDVCVVTCGIKLTYHKAYNDSKSIIINDRSSIKLNISMLNFQRSFDFIKSLMTFLDIGNYYLKFHLSKSYSYISSLEDISSIMSSKDEYTPDKEYANAYSNASNIFFTIYDITISEKNQIPNYIIGISHIEKCDSKDIIKLIDELYDMGIIYKE